MPGFVARVHVELQADGELVQLARLVATGMASSVGMGIDHTEDCRAAIDEMCSSLVAYAAEGAVLALELVAEEPTDGTISLDVRGRVAIDGPVVLDDVRREISEMILDATTDDHDEQVDVERGEATFRFVHSAPRRTTRRSDGDE